MGENQSPKAQKRSRLNNGLGILLFVCLLPILIPALLIAVALSKLYRLVLTLAAWILLCCRGAYVVFVYSDSPNWKEYIDVNILSKIQARSTVLNWSNHSTWKRFDLPVRIFYHFTGETEFNPVAIVFRPFHRTNVFKFWQAFKDLKHGKPETLHKVETAFFDRLKRE
jgi:hypothetical protein